MEAVHAMKEADGICHCATLGRLTEEQARDLKEAGVRRINHNLETSREFYPQIVTTHGWQELTCQTATFLHLGRGGAVTGIAWHGTRLTYAQVDASGTIGNACPPTV